MAQSIEKRLSALEIQHLPIARNLTVRFVNGKSPSAEEEAEHAALRAAGVPLLVVCFVSTGSEQTEEAIECQP